MNEVAKSRKKMTKRKRMKEFAKWSHERESKPRNQGIFLTESYFSVCVFSVEMTQETNEQILEMKS